MTAAAVLSPYRPLALRLGTVRLPRLATRTPAQSRLNRYLIDVDFETPDGERSFAVGGGETLEEAVAVAREALPAGAEWEVVRWNHVHGE